MIFGAGASLRTRGLQKVQKIDKDCFSVKSYKGLDQGCQTYGPWAAGGPQTDLMRPTRKFFFMLYMRPARRFFVFDGVFFYLEKKHFFERLFFSEKKLFLPIWPA